MDTRRPVAFRARAVYEIRVATVGEAPGKHEALGIRGKVKLFAVIKTGGKQYSVTAGDTITVMTLSGEPGDSVAFDHVLMLSGDGEPALGTPFIEGASVAGQIVEQTRGPKAISFKKRRRQNSKRKRGHRQDLTLVRITELHAGGAAPSAGTASPDQA